MKYTSIHLCVRNDYHCPECRVWNLSFHKTLESAILSHNALNMDDVQKGKSMWIDEWVRRRNGDLYRVFNIQLGTYKLEQDLCMYNDDYYKRQNNNGDNDDNQNNDNIRYALIEIKIDKSKWCPDNIKFSITFYRKLKEITKYRSALREGIFVKNRHENKGIFYKLVEIECEKEIELNSFCPQIHRDIW